MGDLLFGKLFDMVLCGGLFVVYFYVCELIVLGGDCCVMFVVVCDVIVVVLVML